MFKNAKVDKAEFLKYLDKEQQSFCKKYPRLFAYYYIGDLTLDDVNSWYNNWKADINLFQLTIYAIITKIDFENYNFTIQDVMDNPDRYIKFMPKRTAYYMERYYN
jgi:hypothetical protein